MPIRRRRRPTHPGAVLSDCLPDAGLTAVEFADRLGVSRRAFKGVLDERRPVTADLAHRLSRALGTSPELWLRLQQAVDLWDALRENKGEYDRIRPIRASPKKHDPDPESRRAVEDGSSP
jgi:antitoxin HigA-1